MARSDNFVQPTDADWVEAAPGIRRRLLGHHEDLMSVEVAFVAGAIGDPHSHPHVQTCYVARGRFEVTIDGKMTVLSAGDSFMVPGDVVHGVVALEEGVLIDNFNPTRQDFLD